MQYNLFLIESNKVWFSWILISFIAQMVKVKIKGMFPSHQKKKMTSARWNPRKVQHISMFVWLASIIWKAHLKKYLYLFLSISAIRMKSDRRMSKNASNYWKMYCQHHWNQTQFRQFFNHPLNSYTRKIYPFQRCHYRCPLHHRRRRHHWNHWNHLNHRHHRHHLKCLFLFRNTIQN